VNFPDVAVSASGILLIGFLAWFFFGPKKARQAELVGQVQQVQVLEVCTSRQSA
jgi:Cu+-exporting ATPase